MRPSKWSNPYSSKESKFDVIKTSSRTESISRFREYFTNNIKLRSQLNELKGKRLACCCKADQPCHVDVILEAVNSDIQALW